MMSSEHEFTLFSCSSGRSKDACPVGCGKKQSEISLASLSLVPVGGFR